MVPLDSASIHIDISPEEDEGRLRGAVALEGDPYSLCLQTRDFHRNVEGPMFDTLLLTSRAPTC